MKVRKDGRKKRWKKRDRNLEERIEGRKRERRKTGVKKEGTLYNYNYIREEKRKRGEKKGRRDGENKVI